MQCLCHTAFDQSRLCTDRSCSEALSLCSAGGDAALRTELAHEAVDHRRVPRISRHVDVLAVIVEILGYA